MPRLSRLAAPALLIVVGLASLIIALQAGGAAAPLALADPGATVRFGLPIATFLSEIGASLTIGTLAVACFCLSADRPEWGRALDIASAGALFWTIASAATGFFTFLSVANVQVTLDEKFGQSLAFFLTGTDLGLAWLVSTLIAALVTVLCFAVRGVTAVFVVAVVAAAGLIPIAQQGHAAGTASHAAAVTALGIHVEGAAVWLGGLLALVLLRSVLERRLAVVLGRYSSIALVCFVIVAVSGVVSAQIRIGGWSELGSAYGLLVVAKSVALVVLGLFGVVHRRVVVGRMADRALARGPFWWFVAAEIAFLGSASGIAAALSRTETPVAQTAAADTADLTPAEVLTDGKLPGPFTPGAWLTAWNVDLVWLLGAVFLFAFYLAGVIRLRRRGESWPLQRTICWGVGLLVLAYATSGAVNVYDRYLMSAHLLQIVLVGLVVPALLVPAAPWTLALRAMAKRTDGSRGPREWTLLVVQSRVAARLTHPFVGGPLLALGLWAAVWPLLRWTVSTELGHFSLVLGLLLSGWLFVQALVGVDPVPLRAGFGVRVSLAALVGAAVLAVGAVLSVSPGLRLASWFGAMGRTWGSAPVADQQQGGVVLGVVGIVVCAVLGAAAVRRRRPVASTE